jgi:hypothetical protein
MTSKQVILTGVGVLAGLGIFGGAVTARKAATEARTAAAWDEVFQVAYSQAATALLGKYGEPYGRLTWDKIGSYTPGHVIGRKGVFAVSVVFQGWGIDGKPLAMATDPSIVRDVDGLWIVDRVGYSEILDRAWGHPQRKLSPAEERLSVDRMMAEQQRGGVPDSVALERALGMPAAER